MPRPPIDLEGLDPSYDFVRRQIDLVGGRDPQEVLEETLEWLEALVHEVPVDRLRQRPSAGKWCAAEILGHLVDCEWAFGHRLRTLLCEEDPVLVPFDQDRWVEVQRHRSREPLELWASFQTLRTQNLLAWSRIDEPALWQRGALHPGAGIRYTLALLHALQAGHDLAHQEQIVRTLDVAEGRS